MEGDSDARRFDLLSYPASRAQAKWNPESLALPARSSSRKSRPHEALMLGDPITDLPLQIELNYFRLAQNRYFVPPGTYSVKFLARENVTGKIGTFETKLVIPDLAAEKSWLPISSVVLSGQIEAQSAAVAAASQDKKVLADHPLIRNGNKIVPSVTRAFHRDQTLYVYLEAFQPDAPKPLQTTVSFYRGKTKVFEAPMEMAKEPFKDQAKVQPIELSIPLQSLEPGRYTCQVSVIDAQSQKVAFWRAPMAVLQ
jgi:hypothetical protein